MKNLITLTFLNTSVVVFLIVGFAQVRQPDIKVTQQRNAWVEKCLRDFESIHIGMRRSEIEKLFPLDGGIHDAFHFRLKHPECGYFKVDIGFSVKRDAQGRAMISPDDSVTTISRPYIERPRMD